MGNGATLSNSNSVWQKIIMDTWDRGCFFSVNDDRDLPNAIFQPIEFDDGMVQLRLNHKDRIYQSYQKNWRGRQ